MGETAAVTLIIGLIKTVGVISLPVLICIFVVGFVSGLGQSVTTIQDPALGQVPKFLAGGLTLILAGGWIASMSTRYLVLLYSDFSRFLGS